MYLEYAYSVVRAPFCAVLVLRGLTVRDLTVRVFGVRARLAQDDTCRLLALAR